MTPPPDKQPAAETPRQVAERIVLDACDNRSVKQINAFVKEDYQRLADTIESALQDRDERAAKIADERAAFNRRLAKTHKIGDPIADLKFTRADEAEIIAKEIRSADA